MRFLLDVTQKFLLTALHSQNVHCCLHRIVWSLNKTNDRKYTEPLDEETRKCKATNPLGTHEISEIIQTNTHALFHAVATQRVNVSQSAQS